LGQLTIKLALKMIRQDDLAIVDIRWNELWHGKAPQCEKVPT